MKTVILILSIIAVQKCFSQSYMEIVKSGGKDTVYNETVTAKFYIYINDSTIKVVYGKHNYSVHEHARDEYWGDEIEPDYFDSYSDENGNGFYQTYPNAQVLYVHDIEVPVIYNSFKHRPKIKGA